MRRKVNIKIPSSDLDYGKKPYASPTAYQGQVRKATSKLEHDNIERQYSEFKRPQGGWESYQDMEQWADNPPGIEFPDFTVPDIPGTEFPVPDFTWGDYFVCFCGIDKCYCPGQITCFDPGCTYPIVGALISGMVSGFKLTRQKNRICIDAPADAVGPVEVTLMLLKLKPDGKGGVISAGTCVVGKIYDKCRDSECCAETEDMAWDEDTSAETVGKSSSCIVAITDEGDGSPYTWSVEGTGFWFNSGHSVTSMETSSKVVALYTDGDACGSATITVTGCAGQVVAGYVRCTSAGSWNDLGPGLYTACGAWDTKNCGYGWPHYYCIYTKTSGKYKQQQRTITNCGWSGVGECDTTTCLTPVLCSDILDSAAWFNESTWNCCVTSGCDDGERAIANRTDLSRLWEWKC